MKQKLRVFLTLLLCAVASVGWGQTTVTDVLTYDLIGVTGNSYSSWSGKTSNSTAVYAGQSAGSYNSIQLRSKNSNSGIVTTSSGGKVKSVIVVLNSNTTASGRLDVYGKNTAYTSPENLYSGDNQGTRIGSVLMSDGETSTITVSDDYEYIGFRSYNGAVYVDEITIVWEQVASTAFATTTTINSAGITNTDVHAGTAGGQLTATVTADGTAIEGATVTWSSSKTDVATIDASGNVTLVAAGTTTITAYYAGVENQYKPSEDTYELTVIDSTPFSGGDVTFDATIDKGTSPLEKNGVNFACTNGALDNGSEYRLYKSSTTTFSVSEGVITQIVFTGVSGNPASGFADQDGWTADGNNGTWTGSAQSVSFTASGAQVRATKIVVTVDLNAVPASVINASDVNITYDATGGNIEFTVDNPIEGTSLTAVVKDGNWLELGNVTGNSVSFTCDANTESVARTSVVTLTYGDVTKDVTVTQAAAPLIYTTIPDLLAAATSTSTPVTVTFGNWVVSGVNSNQLFVTDGTNGFIMYQSNHGFAVGNTLSGTVSCNLVLFNGSAEITGVTSETEGLTVGTNGSVTPVVTTIDALGAVNTGSVVTLNNLTYNGSVLSDETNEVTPYNSLYRDMSFEANRVYNVTGVFVMNNTTKRILPRSADDIEEVVDGREDPEIAFTPSTITITQDEQFDQPTFGNPNNVSVSFDTTNADVASWNNGLELGSSTGTATITATFEGNDSYLPATATLVVTVNEKGAASAMFDFDNNYATLFPYLEGTSSSSSTAGDITEDLTATVDGVSLTVSAAESGTANRIWNGSPRLRMYSGTLTISAPANSVITELTINQGKWNSGNTADTGTLTSTNWTGNAQTVVITIAGNTQFKSIDVKYVPVETVTATISAAGYATFANAKTVDFTGTGVKVMTALYENGKITYTEVTSKQVPAGEAVILQGDAGTYNATVIESAEELQNNSLLVNLNDNIESDGSYYCLANKSKGVGFYKVANGTIVKQGKAYLVIPAEAKDFFSINDETDGIGQIEMGQTSNAEIYNLSGQRVNKAQKGVYIVNGKKVVVK